ncbi:MAG: D-alanine--D-alanine ligase family protein [Limnochordia bacterium]|jgi:D-alanine-D-alanine ligase
MPKLRVGVIYGGRSGEHEVSLMSAQSVISALDKEKYEIIPIKIDKDGRWSDRLIAADPTRDAGLDVVFPVLHGTFGEDGTMQGLLELANLPYVGAGVASSAVSMDKSFMRVLFANAGLPILPWEVVFNYEWREEPEQVTQRLEEALGYPMFVKPANLGSSVGVTKVKRREDLAAAMELALSFDRKAVVEKGLEGGREVECSVLGHTHPEASIPGEIVPCNEFYDYEAKYLEDSELIIPARLSEEQIATVREYACRAFKAVDCSGLARVDFFVDGGGNVLLNEINTIPGFTHISMYPKLWEHTGLSYPALLDRLIEIAIEKHQERQALRTSIY